MSKVVALLQDRITEANTLDLQKEMLAYHSSFDSYEVYKLLDADNNGYITAQELETYFAKDEDLVGTRYDLLIRYWNKGASDQLNYNQFRDGIASYESAGGYNDNRFQYPPRRDNDENLKAVQDNSWRQ